MYRRCLRSVGVLFALLLPTLVFAAQVAFVEVMFDPDGADQNREWMRVQNTSGSALDLTGWKLYENGSNHLLKPVGTAVVPAGAHAIIADDAVQFAAEHPRNADILFDSSFSLNNSGEALVLKDSSGSVVAEITYSGKPKKAATAPRVLKKELPLAVAAAATPGNQFNGSGVWPWLLAVFVLIVVAGVGVLSARKPASLHGYKVVDISSEPK